MYQPFVTPVPAQQKYREQISGELFDSLEQAELRSREIMFAINSADPNDPTTHVPRDRPLLDYQNLYRASIQ